MRRSCTWGYVLMLVVSQAIARCEEPTTKVWMKGADTNRFLVNLNCDPQDLKPIRESLQLAKTLCHKESEVILFIDLQAVVIADPQTPVLGMEDREAVDRLFQAFRKAGGRVWLCPHCTDELKLDRKKLREGMHFTSKAELDQAKKDADRIFEYQKPEQADETQSQRNLYET